ncbi:MAG TPA: biopolymer transporter ExbD [Acetobacteraceae bacterium]|nr:biopolymer transporter ExbD [Acetobacteraceae bacterium]
MQIQEEKPYDDINITPMLDLAYVLLVIFIIMTTASVQGMKVDLPSGSSSTKLVEKKTVVISVSNVGTIGVDATPVSMNELESRLRTDMAGSPDLNVVLKGDRAVQYQKVMDVLDLCGRLGIRSIGLATQRSGS